MSSKFDVEIKNLIKVYEANDNIGPGDASGFVSALGSLAKTVYGTYNYLTNFKSFYRYALKQADKINEEAKNIQNLNSRDPYSTASIKRKSKLQYVINELREDIKKWREYLSPLKTKSAMRSKAALDVISSVVDNAEHGNIKKRYNTLKTNTPVATPATTPPASSP
jgi:hypothetical protein